jgi:hypothetical protein
MQKKLSAGISEISSETGIIGYHQCFFPDYIWCINIICSNLNTFQKFWKNIWIRFDNLGQNSNMYFRYCEEHEISVPRGIFTQQKKNLGCPYIFFRRRKSTAKSKYIIHNTRYYLCRSTCKSTQHDLLSTFHSGQIFPKLI